MRGIIDIDTLAQEIRRVDGGNNLGAGALAEALMPFITAAVSKSLSLAQARHNYQMGLQADQLSIGGQLRRGGYDD